MKKRVSQRQRPYGYTLIEILIVMAILAAVSALAVPALRGPLERTRLRSAARNVQSAIGKARNAAIRSGRIHTIEYEPGGPRYRLASAPEPALTEFETGAATSAIPDTVDELLDPTDADQSAAIAFELPTGVFFAQPVFQPSEFGTDPIDAGPDSQAPVSEQDSDVVNDAAESITWAPPVTLYPNGRTDDITIRIATKSSFINLSIRGLTGTASFSKPRRWPTIDGTDVSDPSEATRSTTNPIEHSLQRRP